MKDYINNIKQIFSCSDRIAMIFKGEENIWCNRSAEFFGGQLPLCHELETVKIKKKENNILSEVILNTGSMTLKGELHENKDYSFALLDKIDIISDAFKDSSFQKYIESNNLYIKAAINEIGAYITLMRNNGFRNDKELQEYYNGIETSCMGIMKTVQNNDIMRDTSGSAGNMNVYLNLREIFDEIVSSVMASCSKKIKIRYNVKDQKMYVRCDETLLKLLFLHVFRYMIFSSYSMEMCVNESITGTDTAEILFTAPKKEKNINLTMDFYDKMINFNMDGLLVQRLSDSVGAVFEKKEFDKKISMVLKFNLCSPENLNSGRRQEKHTKYSPTNITFFDFL